MSCLCTFAVDYFHAYIISDMRSDVQEIFRMTPHEKQVMMFSATLAKDIRPVCKKFMQDVIIHSLPFVLGRNHLAAPVG